MTKAEKRRFIRELFTSIQKTVLEKVEKMPEEWDGLELRELAASHFDRSCSLRYDQWHRVRLRDYKNEVIVRNL